MDQKTKNFRLQGKAFFLTYPQCTESKEDLAAFLRGRGAITKMVVSREKHESGEPHLHAYVNFKEKLRTTKQDYFDFNGHHGNYQTCRNLMAVLKYVKKDEDYLEEGIEVEAYENGRKNHRAVINSKLVSGEITVEDAVKEDPSLIHNYKKLLENVNLFKLNTTKPEDGERVNYWIYGKPGIGKSQWARRNFPNAFKKACNKWWDGYRGQEYVIVDDLDTNVLGHYLKIWGDNYACDGEIKGGTIPLKYKQMIVTSNYKISELWEKDNMMMEAVARRFKTYTIEGDYNNGYNLKEIDGIYKY